MITRKLNVLTGMLLAVFVFVFVPTQAGASVQETPQGLAEFLTSAGARSALACEVVTITSNANGRYVTAEISRPGADNGVLRARATAAAEWEYFYACSYSGSRMTLQSLANSRYVTAEISRPGENNGMLRARATVVGEWEWFTYSICGSDCVTFRSSANSRYVTAELSRPAPNTGMLRARATVVGEWERFR